MHPGLCSLYYDIFQQYIALLTVWHHIALSPQHHDTYRQILANTQQFVLYGFNSVALIWKQEEMTEVVA